MRQTTGYQARPRIAAILIVKGAADEAAHLARCLANITPHVDGVFLNINYPKGEAASPEVVAVAKQWLRGKFGDHVILTEWAGNFAAARNANLAQVPKDYDWIIWLDADDTVKHPKKIREVAEASAKYDCIYVDYDYDHDEFGNATTVHMVGRLFKHNGSQHWNAKTAIHETLIETRSSIQGMTKDFRVVHHAEPERTAASFERNIAMLQSQLEAEAKDPDPRTFYYLASTYMDAGQLDTAKDLFKAYLDVSGWDQERSVALTKLGRIYLDEGDRSAARDAFAQAVAEDPANPDPRVELGSLEIELTAFHKARSWLEPVEKMDKSQTTLERNPLTWTFRTYILLAETYTGLGGAWLDKAEKYARKALKYKSTDADVKNYVATIIQVNADRKDLQRLVTKYKNKLDKGNKKAARRVLDAIPEHLADNPVVAALRAEGKPFKWPAKSICIMTGDTALDEWGPWSLAEGIGGSEEAIIRLAPKLAKLGYKVVVFAKPGARTGLYDGVVWRNYWECNLKDSYDIFVAWRAPFIFENKIKARKSYLWMHDVMEEGEFTPGRIANFTKCILLSKYHRSLFPMIPEDKVLMSGNGIDPEEFEGLDLPRDPHKILYASSHVRGLAYLYKIWPEVKAAVPDASLDVYYGRESYDKVHKGNPERMKWMDDMINKAQALEGVTDHGKVSQTKITQAGFRSGIWAYPCPFPEIYCITAIKSQASGAVPVASDYAALDETIQYGHKQSLGEFDEADLRDYRDALIYWLLHPEEQAKIRPAMMAWARTQSWQAIAEQWTKEFAC